MTPAPGSNGATDTSAAVETRADGDIAAELRALKDRVRALEEMVTPRHFPGPAHNLEPMGVTEEERQRQQLWADRIQFVMTHGGGRGQLSYEWFTSMYHCGDKSTLAHWLNHSGNLRGIAPGSAVDRNIRAALARERTELLALTGGKAPTGVGCFIQQSASHSQVRSPHGPGRRHRGVTADRGRVPAALPRPRPPVNGRDPRA